MSFSGYKDLIEEGDTVILYVSFNSMYAIGVTPTKKTKKGETVENVFQSSYGALKVKNLVGKRFGTKVQLSRGFAYALHPTPDLWTKTLPHRTQILYATDISMVIQQLELRPGSLVIESGTGSGSLSHSLVRSVAPTGHLYTFDFHQNRVDIAKQEFADHKIDQLVTAMRGDACADGFGDDLVDKVDAVFLDLPHPWDAVPHAKRCISKSRGGRLCSFSPCVEQVQKTIAALKAEGFAEVATMECLLREFQVRRITVPTYDPNREAKKKNYLSRGEEDQKPGEKRKRDDGDDGSATLLDKSEPCPPPDKSFLTGIPLLTMPGHTGYLTFATLPVFHSAC